MYGVPGDNKVIRMGITIFSSVTGRYYTSKCHAVSDLDNLGYFGYRGEAVASLREISAVLEIVSRTKFSQLSYCKLFRNGDPLPVIESIVPRPSVGTTVTAHDLFYNFPVRQKHANENLEFEKIRQRLEAIALVQSSVSVSLRNDSSGQVVMQTHKTNSLLNTFTSLFGAAKSKCLCEMKAENDYFKIQAYLGKEGSSRKDHQFVYVNKRLVLKTDISKLLNSLLGKSLIVKTKTTYAKALLEDSPTKHVDRYPIFVVLVDCVLTEYDITFEPAKTLVQFKHWESLRDSLEKLVQSFLVKENLLLSKGDSFSPKHSSSEKELFEETPVEASVGTVGSEIHTNKIRAGMSSKLVRRKKDFYHEENIGIISDPSPKNTGNEDIYPSNSSTNQASDSNEEAAPQSVCLQTDIQEDSAVEHFFVDTEEEKSLVSCDIENCTKEEVKCRTNGQDSKVKDFKTPLINRTERKEPPIILHKKVCDSQVQAGIGDVQADMEDSLQDYDMEDPLDFRRTDSLSQDKMPEVNARRNYICITTPHISPGGNSTLSAFRKSLLSSRNSGERSSRKLSLAEKLRLRKSKAKRMESKSCERNGRRPHLTDIAEHVSDHDCPTKSRNSLSPMGQSFSHKQQSVVHKQRSVVQNISVPNGTTSDSHVAVPYSKNSSTTTANGEISASDSGRAVGPKYTRKSLDEKQIDICQKPKRAFSMACQHCDSDIEMCEACTSGRTRSTTSERIPCSDLDSKAVKSNHKLLDNDKDQELQSEVNFRSDHQESLSVESNHVAVQTESNHVTKQTSKRASKDMADSTAAKLPRMTQRNISSDSMETENDERSSNKPDSTLPKGKFFSMYSDLEELTIPGSLQQGLQLKFETESEAGKNSKLSEERKFIYTAGMLQTAQDYNKMQTETENVSQNVSEKFETRNNIKDFEIWPPRNVYLNQSHKQACASAKRDKDSFEKPKSKPNCHLKDPFIVDIDDTPCNSENRLNGLTADSRCILDAAVDSDNAPNRNMLDIDCNLFCDETLDDIVTSIRRVKTNNEGKQCVPESEPFWHIDDSQEFIPTNLTFDSDFSKEIQEPSRVKLNLSLVDSLGFSFSSVNGTRSGENTPNTPNSDLTVPKFEQRTCCSPTGSEGFSPDLDPDHELSHSLAYSGSSMDDGKLEKEVSEQNLKCDASTSECSEIPMSLTLSRVLGEVTDKPETGDQSSSSCEGDGFSKWFSLGSSCSTCEENSKAQNNDFMTVPDVSLSETTQLIVDSEPCDTHSQVADHSTQKYESSECGNSTPTVHVDNRRSLGVEIVETKTDENIPTDPTKDTHSPITPDTTKDTHSHTPPNTTKDTHSHTPPNTTKDTHSHTPPNTTKDTHSHIAHDSVLDTHKRIFTGSTKDARSHIPSCSTKDTCSNHDSAECGVSSPWSEVADEDLLEMDVGCERVTDEAPPKTWIRIADKKTGRDVFVNKNTGHTVTNEKLIPNEDDEGDNVEAREPLQCRRLVKRAGTSCPSITSSVRAMIEEHFDADDEMSSVKWKDKTTAMETSKAGQSVADLFKEWENPVFPRPDMEILNAEILKERTPGASRAQRSLNPCTFTKDMLKTVEVLGQMDRKFITCLMKTENSSPSTGLIVVFDQHAAHERVRLEELTKGCYESCEGKQFKSCLLSPEEELKLTEEDVRVMEAFRGEFQRLGINFSRSKLSKDSILIKEIPSCITAKEEKQREGIVILNILKNTITEHVQFLKSTKGARDRMPLTIHKLLCGLACRGAIKFGDPLSKEECENLIMSLARCHLPFQCAHGRPSVMPLVSTEKLHKYVPRRPNLWKIAGKLQHKK
ncbi:uncharacterized protein LOC125649424 isoform X3 [Ostrea edulis]|uniref:uncharacterized protein LOC125649424 isoform X3 n=1 Tax=Ostrea edulis TaxID=37623 RepID=UPI0024AF1DDE|nr:uncharacterized protein LOC125649424 isoform X3 [Ostrea edulis]